VSRPSGPTTPTTPTTYVPFADLEELLRTILVRHGVSDPNARIIAHNCASCERDGSVSHGVFRIPGYLASLENGWLDGCAVPHIERHGPSFLRVDARNGFAQTALHAAMPTLLEMVAETGLVMVAIRNSHHFSALWPDLEPLAERELVALTMVGGLLRVAMPGGRQPVFGTNPIAFATPVAGARPLIMDLATSAMSNGDVQLAERAGRPVPVGTGIDRDGAASVDPAAILDGGSLLPFGGHKGAALSFMVEVLAAALTAGLFSHEVDYSEHPGAETPRTGQALIVIDPTRGGNEEFAQRVMGLVATVRASGDVRLPSDRRYRFRDEADRRGIPIDDQQLAQLRTLAG
jgi:delta1-piperideine-2-carboxylate reductase